MNRHRYRRRYRSRWNRLIGKKNKINNCSIEDQLRIMKNGFYLKDCNPDQIVNNVNILKFRLWGTKKPVMTSEEQMYTMVLLYLNKYPNPPEIQQLEEIVCKIKNISPYVFLNLLNLQKINSLKIKTHFLTQLNMDIKLREKIPKIIKIAIKNDIDYIVDYLHGLGYLAANDHDFVINKYVDDPDKLSYLFKIGYKLSLETFIKIAPIHSIIEIPNYDDFINRIVKNKKQSNIISTIGSTGTITLYEKLKSSGWVIKNKNIDKLYNFTVNKCNIPLAKKIIIENKKKKWMIKDLLEKINKSKKSIYDKYSKDLVDIIQSLDYKSFNDSLFPLIHKKEILNIPMDNNDYHLSNSQILTVFNRCIKTDDLSVLKQLIDLRIIDPIDLAKPIFLSTALNKCSIEIAKYLIIDLKLRLTDKNINSIIIKRYGYYKIYRSRIGQKNKWNTSNTEKILKLLITFAEYKPSNRVCEKFVNSYDLFILLLDNGGSVSKKCFKKAILNVHRQKVAKFLFMNKEKYKQDTTNIIQYILQPELRYSNQILSLDNIVKIIKDYDGIVNQQLIPLTMKINRLDLLKYFIKNYKLVVLKQDVVSYFKDEYKLWFKIQEREKMAKMVKYLVFKSGIDLSDMDWINIGEIYHTEKIHKIINSKYNINYNDEFIARIIKSYNLKIINYILKKSNVSISKNNIFNALMMGWTQGATVLISHSNNINFTIKDMNTLAINSCRYSIFPIDFIIKHFNITPTVYTVELLVLSLSPFAHHKLIPLIKKLNFITQRIINTLIGDAHREALKKPINQYQISPDEIPDILGENPYNMVFGDIF